jgi:hypothetical protein
MSVGQGISASAGLSALVVAGIMWFIVGRWQPRYVVLLIVAGMAGLAGSGFGQGLHRGAGYVDGKVSVVVGQYTGATIVGLVALITLAAVTVGVLKNKVSGRTLVAALVLPAVVTMIPGVFGQVATATVSALASGVGMGIGVLFGAGG